MSDKLATRPEDKAQPAHASRWTPNERLQASCVVALFVAMFLFGWAHPDGTMLGISSTAIVLALVVLRFDSIRRLKAGSFELEGALRRAERVTEEAVATVMQLRAISAVLGKATLDALGVYGRWGGSFPLAEKVAKRDELISALRVAGCSDEQIADARKLLDETLRWDVARRIFALADVVVKDFNHPYFKGKETLLKSTGRKFSAATADEVRRMLSECHVVHPEVTRRVDDYQRYEETGAPPETSNDANEEADVKLGQPKA
jgi:hypothetical protein